MYSSIGLQINRGIFNAQQTAGSFKSSVHSYKSNTDTISDIITANYFPDNFDSDINDIKVGDLIWLVGTDNFVISKITSLVPASVIVSPMTNVFPDGLTTSQITISNGNGSIDFFASDSFGVSWSGPFASPVFCEVQAYVINNVCTLIFVQLPFTSAVTPSAISMTPNLPLPIRPSSDKSFGPFLMLNNDTRVLGTVFIDSSGVVTISSDLESGTPFNGPGSCGFFTMSVSFNID